MTAQCADILLHEGERLDLCTLPLDNYFDLGGSSPAFLSFSTALHRGYIATWEIAESRLYLVGLEGTLAGDTEASVASVFPGYPDRVFAHWFSGTLRAPQGRLLDYAHAMFASVYERDLLIEVGRGVVQRMETRHNGVADDEDAPEGYVVGGALVFSEGRPA